MTQDLRSSPGARTQDPGLVNQNLDLVSKTWVKFPGLKVLGSRMGLRGC